MYCFIWPWRNWLCLVWDVCSRITIVLLAMCKFIDQRFRLNHQQPLPAQNVQHTQSHRRVQRAAANRQTHPVVDEEATCRLKYLILSLFFLDFSNLFKSLYVCKKHICPPQHWNHPVDLTRVRQLLQNLRVVFPGWGRREHRLHFKFLFSLNTIQKKMVVLWLLSLCF